MSWRYHIKIYLPVVLGSAAFIAMLHAVLTRQDTSPSDTPVILQHREGCLHCHENSSGFSKAHLPEAIGCSSCHLGNPFRLQKEAAHENMVLVPGNIRVARRTCGQSPCHPQLTTTIQNTLMATGRGMVTVNRFVFGEAPTPDGQGHLSQLTHSPADDHLRKLCASCHLSKIKDTPRPIDELSRGGGCTACHLSYSAKARAELLTYQNGGEVPHTHPALTIQVTDEHCFGCHSRSGRVSTNYAGWHETELSANQMPDTTSFRRLQDGRVFARQTPDVHFEKGLACIDCHTWRETMGDGQNYNHQEEQVEIACTDCHRIGAAQTVDANKLGPIELKILRQRGWPKQGLHFVTTGKTALPLTNVYRDSGGNIVLKGKNSGKSHVAKPPSAVCTSLIQGHERLSCQSCHTAWAPQCISCHTERDPRQRATDHLTGEKTKGRWVEYSGEMFADPPALGILTVDGKERVDSFIPGMVLTISSKRTAGTKPGESYEIFRRLYAPTAAHTISRARTCKSCHNDPLALGFGRGRLTYKKVDSRHGEWSFSSTYANHPADDLPFDAWTGFLQERSDQAATRTGARPFSVEEQRRILQVGTCLTCHSPDAKNIKRIYADFQAAMENVSIECVLPVWK